MEVGGASMKNSLAAKKTEEIARMRAAMTPEQRNEEFIKMLAERGVSIINDGCGHFLLTKGEKAHFYDSCMYMCIV